MTDLQRDAPLFDRLLPIQISNGIDEPRDTTLVLRILRGTQTTSTAGQLENVLHFEVTDDSDHYFLYYLDVGEQSFHRLKRDQAILVEFKVFPIKFIELVNLCLENPFTNPICSASSERRTNSDSAGSGSSSLVVGATPESATLSSNEVRPAREENNHSTHAGESSASTIHRFAEVPTTGVPAALTPVAAAVASSEQSYFSARLNTSTGVLSIVESNKFKQLTHISLVLLPGDDAAIKFYLASRLGLTLSVAQRQSLDIHRLERRLTSEIAQRQDATVELEQLRTMRSVEQQSIKSEHSRAMSELQTQTMQTIEAMRVKYEAQLDATKNQLDTLQRDTLQRCAGYEQAIADLNHEKSQLEFKLRDTARHLQSAETDRDRLMQECAELTERQRGGEGSIADLERESLKISAQNAALIQQLADRDESMKKSAALQRAAEEAKASVEERLLLYIANAETMQENLRECSAEIDKGNIAISKLHTDMRSLKEKVKLKTEVIRKQESLVAELRAKLLEMEKDAVSQRDAHNSSQHTIESQRRQLEEAKARLSESNKIIASNQEVITYLNEEINKWQLGMRVQDDTPILSHSSGRAHIVHHTNTPPFGNGIRSRVGGGSAAAVRTGGNNSKSAVGESDNTAAGKRRSQQSSEGGGGGGRGSSYLQHYQNIVSPLGDDDEDKATAGDRGDGEEAEEEEVTDDISEYLRKYSSAAPAYTSSATAATAPTVAVSERQYQLQKEKERERELEREKGEKREKERDWERESGRVRENDVGRGREQDDLAAYYAPERKKALGGLVGSPHKKSSAEEEESAGGGSTGGNVYLRGIKNLGLGDVLMSEDAGFIYDLDAALVSGGGGMTGAGAEDYSGFLYSSSAGFRREEGVKKLDGRGVGWRGGGEAGGERHSPYRGVDIDALDYYATGN